MQLTTKNGAGFVDNRLDMDGKLFGLGGDVTTGGDDDERVRLAIRVFEIEPAEEYRRGRRDALAEGHSLAYSCYDWGGVSIGVSREVEGNRTVSSENVEEVKEQGVFHVTHVLCSCLFEGCTVDDPSLAYGGNISLSFELDRR